MTNNTDREATRDAWEDAVARGDHDAAIEIAAEFKRRNGGQ